MRAGIIDKVGSQARRSLIDHHKTAPRIPSFMTDRAASKSVRIEKIRFIPLCGIPDESNLETWLAG